MCTSDSWDNLPPDLFCTLKRPNTYAIELVFYALGVCVTHYMRYDLLLLKYNSYYPDLAKSSNLSTVIGILFAFYILVAVILGKQIMILYKHENKNEALIKKLALENSCARYLNSIKRYIPLIKQNVITSFSLHEQKGIDNNLSHFLKTTALANNITHKSGLIDFQSFDRTFAAQLDDRRLAHWRLTACACIFAFISVFFFNILDLALRIEAHVMAYIQHLQQVA